MNQQAEHDPQDLLKLLTALMRAMQTRS